VDQGSLVGQVSVINVFLNLKLVQDVSEIATTIVEIFDKAAGDGVGSGYDSVNLFQLHLAASVAEESVVRHEDANDNTCSELHACGKRIGVVPLETGGKGVMASNTFSTLVNATDHDIWRDVIADLADGCRDTCTIIFRVVVVAVVAIARGHGWK